VRRGDAWCVRREWEFVMNVQVRGVIVTVVIAIIGFLVATLNLS
jgi:hypothetical protein